jgi:hypothetical protein
MGGLGVGGWVRGVLTSFRAWSTIKKQIFTGMGSDTITVLIIAFLYPALSLNLPG